MTKIYIGWENGRYFFQRTKKQKGFDIHDVPESTIQMWEAIAQLDDMVMKQLRDLDNSQQECDDCDGSGIYFIDGQPQMCICKTG